MSDNIIQLKDKGEGKATTSAFSQYSTFYLADRLYGIEVTRVQEIVRAMPMTSVPLAASHVRGLINLRGQLATAIGLRELFGLNENKPTDLMNVVCKIDGALLSMQVDEIGDVVEVETKFFESTPQTVPDSIGKFMLGVYKTSGDLLSVLDIDTINNYLNSKAA